MMYRLYIRILSKNIKVITNSKVLKNLIKYSLAIKKPVNRNPSLILPLMLKKPDDFQESIDIFTKFIKKICSGINNDYIFLHAAAFSFKNKATILLGQAESGKSTLLLSSALCGSKVISDEPVLIEVNNGAVLPFIYLIKIAQPKEKIYNFLYMNISDIKNDIIKFKDYNLIFFKKEVMEKLGIGFEKKKVPLKNIIFLEKKKYDPLIHLAKYCLNYKGHQFTLLKLLKNITHKKNIIFLDKPLDIIKNKQAVIDFISYLN